jgi:DNA polymerase
MGTIHLDFETYSEANLKETGAFRYAEDPSTEVLILAYSLGSGPTIGVDLSKPEDRVPQALHPLFWAVEKGHTVCAHNAQFERLIWTKVLTYFPIRPRPNQWDCTAARARMLALPGSLDGAAGALGVDTRKDPRGKALIELFSKPQKGGRRIMPTDEPQVFQEFIAYCKQDVEVERKLDKILPPLSPVEAEAFALDYLINENGMPVNMELVNRAFHFVEEYSAKLMEKAQKIAGCRPTQREKTLEFLASRGYALPNLQAPTVEALAGRPGMPEDIVQLLDHRIELSRAGTKKLTAIRNTVSADGRIRGGFLFSAASTRRWSSTGVQLHNLQKPEGETNPEVLFSLLMADPELLPDMFDRPLTALAQSIRGFLEAKDHFHVADYSSVEPKGLAWMAGEEWILQAYRDKKDAYKMTAARVYGIPEASIAKDSLERFMGKQLVLGCGYGMGADRFIDTCAKFGQVLTIDASKEAVYGYRKSVPHIVGFWKTLEAACIKAVKEWKTLRVGKLKFRPVTLANGFRVLFVDMPSGTIAYPKPSIGHEVWMGQPRDTFEFYTPLGSAWVKTDTFGGSLAENVVQALTRDILRDGLLAAHKAGHKIVAHVHDEAIAEGANNKADYEDFEHCLVSGSEEWAKGFPVGVDGFISKRYKK